MSVGDCDRARCLVEQYEVGPKGPLQFQTSFRELSATWSVILATGWSQVMLTASESRAVV